MISCDPIYNHSPDEIRTRIGDCFKTVLEQTRLHAGEFVWSNGIPDVDALGRTRMHSMRLFLDDFHNGKRQGRYVAAELPSLPFQDSEFDLAVCSHYLFLYDSLGVDFHVQSVIELARVAAEVRIFPLVQLDGRKSVFLPAVIESLGTSDLVGEIVTVDYEFQRGAFEMLRVRLSSR